ncbi:cullin-4A [Trichonephila clavipes]|nr:cullin-4A [Trichonephila clavipes]
MSSLGFEPSPYGTVVSVANHYTGWATLNDTEVAWKINVFVLLKFRKELGSNPGEDRNVCKCLVPLRQGSTLNSLRATSHLVWLVEGEERWETPDNPQVFLPLNWVGVEPNCTVTCMVLKAKANDRRKNSSPEPLWISRASI